MSATCKPVQNNSENPQCQHFVLRKKRLCRMTVKPGKHYCGEHEPQPRSQDGQDDTRIPCPNDPKHTCYVSKLEKHLSICNARQQDQPDYIVHNVNVPKETDDCPRRPLSKIPLQRILQVIKTVNVLYDTYIKDQIATLAEQPIHSAVLSEFNEPGRTESSLRHLRQASSLLHIIEGEGLVANNTVYVELGAGKGQLSCFAWRAWCRGTGSRVLLVDRAALRHKRDGRLRGAGAVRRVRADLAHLALGRAPAADGAAAAVACAKHLCGAATDLALRCLTAADPLHVRGAALAACCHHRCTRAAYPAADLLQDLGIDAEDFNALLGIVSWATCGDGRSRDRRNNLEANKHDTESHTDNTFEPDCDNPEHKNGSHKENDEDLQVDGNPKTHLPETVDNVKCDDIKSTDTYNTKYKIESRVSGNPIENEETNDTKQNGDEKKSVNNNQDTMEIEELGTKMLNLSQEQREETGRRAKALLDWGRVQFLRGRGFDARLVYYVPAGVSLENVCIVASKSLSERPPEGLTASQ